MKISIAMATYNGAKYLQEQLDSFLLQTRLPDQLIITDDGSTDDTLDIVKRFAETAPFQVIYSQNMHNLGYAGNFNVALQKTTGDLVFLSDQDDVWFPEKISRMVSISEANPEALVLMNDALLTDEALHSNGLTKIGQMKSAGFKLSGFVMGCCAVVKRDLLDFSLPIPDAYPAHDNWIVGIAEGMRRKHIYPQVLQYYRRHGNNESEWIVNSTTRVTRWDVLIQDLKRRFKKNSSADEVLSSIKASNALSLELLYQWADRAVESVQEPYASDLRQYKVLLDQQLKNDAKRNEIRMQDFPARLGAIGAFWLSGGYTTYSGWKSALRDTLGK